MTTPGFIDVTERMKGLAPFARLAALTDNTFTAEYRVDPRGDRASIAWTAVVRGSEIGGAVDVVAVGAQAIDLSESFRHVLSNLAESAYENIRRRSKALGGPSW